MIAGLLLWGLGCSTPEDQVFGHATATSPAVTSPAGSTTTTSSPATATTDTVKLPDGHDTGAATTPSTETTDTDTGAPDLGHCEWDGATWPAEWLQCSTDAECGEISLNCCPCEQGGEYIPIAATYAVCPLECDPLDVMCAQVFVCDGLVPACEQGSCVRR